MCSRRQFSLAAGINEAQLMGWKLTLRGLGSQGAEQVLAEREFLGAATNGIRELARLEPHALPNGICRLRLSAWDLLGRTHKRNPRVECPRSRNPCPLCRTYGVGAGLRPGE
jgi:hypothetical protein